MAVYYVYFDDDSGAEQFKQFNTKGAAIEKIRELESEGRFRKWSRWANAIETPLDLPTGYDKKLLNRISIDPNICFGKPCIRGHRIWVSLILDLLASGMTIPNVLEEYPGIEEADVLACIAYGAEMSRERFVEVALES
jgi:uncharacterized protein (DUF433 family)